MLPSWLAKGVLCSLLFLSWCCDVLLEITDWNSLLYSTNSPDYHKLPSASSPLLLFILNHSLFRWWWHKFSSVFAVSFVWQLAWDHSVWVPTGDLWACSCLQMLHSGAFVFHPNNAKNLSKYTTVVLFPLQCLAVKLANSLCFHLKCPLLEMRGINHCACLAPTCPLCHISLNFLQHGRKAAGPLTLSSLGATVSQPLISIFNELSAMI